MALLTARVAPIATPPSRFFPMQIEFAGAARENSPLATDASSVFATHPEVVDHAGELVREVATP